MTINRYEHNPILTPQSVQPSRSDFEVIGVFNCGVARLGEEVILLLRVAERPKTVNDQEYLAPIFDPEKGELINIAFDKSNPDCDFSDSRVIRTKQGTFLTSISHLRVARSMDGVHFTVEDRPALFPENLYENYGIEDPRITQIGDIYYINYSAISTVGITTCLASTTDFVTFERHGVIFHPDNKDVEIFPERIEGKYYALHRPSSSHFGKPEMWMAESPDLICWGNHRYLTGTREGMWDSSRIGGSAIPFKVGNDWLEIYHGADDTQRYCLGALLLDGTKPWIIKERSRRPIIEPETDYEVNGFFGNVIFTCGVLFEEDIIKLYYGVADTSIAYAELSLKDIFDTF